MEGGGGGGGRGEVVGGAGEGGQAGGRDRVKRAALERSNEVDHRFKATGGDADMVMVKSSGGSDMADGRVRLEALDPVFVVTAQRVG